MEKTIGLVGAVVFVASLWGLPQVHAQKIEGETHPVRITIPQIKVNAPIIPVGILSSGAMDSPKRLSDVGWLDSGYGIGEVGTMVLAGHFGARSAAFNRLSAVRRGDKIFVENSEGKKIRYIVKQTKSYAAHAVAEDVFVSSDDGAYLNLITCQGWWNPFTRNYSKRFVVFAELE